jgi:methionyl-tRNA formyltransferase
MRILFWGTPEFATAPLRALIGEGFEVVGVVTQPDRPQGRSRSVLVPSPVKKIAVEEGIPVLQPERPKGESFLAAVRELATDLSVVVAYGHLLPRDVIDFPPQGTINIHASLLPRWRGAAPIQASILAGDAETGITIMRMVSKLDAGPVILRSPIPIVEDETYGELQLRLSELGALAVVEALALISLGAATEEPQDDSLATLAPKIEREDARLQWSRPAFEIGRRIRAFDPRPGAWALAADTEVKLFGARAERIPGSVEAPPHVPGTIVDVGATGILVACGDSLGAIRVSDVQPAGKRRMPAAEWARGVRLGTGALLT